MAAERTDDRIELTDLDLISRYSLAVRTATAPIDEVVAALRADLDWLEGLRRGGKPRTRPARAARDDGAASPAAPAKAAAKKTTRRAR